MKPDYLALIHAAEHLADQARACLASQDRGEEPKTGLLRQRIEELRREMEKWA